MRLLLFWTATTIVMAAIGNALHKRGIGPIHAVRRLTIYLSALGDALSLAWTAGQWEFRHQWPSCVARALRRW